MIQDSELNKKQLEAVEHVDGPLLVLAGAGSGKTRVVSHRIARLLDMGILPSDILAVTFTNKAAQEMKNRILKLKGKNVLTSTFHSLGARILRESIHQIGYKNDFTIYDEDDSEKLLKTCLQSLQIKEEKGFLKKCKLLISSCKNDLILPTDLHNITIPHDLDLLFPKIYLLYQTKLRACNALDFDDLLFLTVHLFKENEDLHRLYQERWLFLLIDEYQDTNLAQYELTKMLTSKHKNIFAVGDPDQSIYSWRGARYQNILNFSSDFPGAKVIRLEQNYRSTNTILEASNALIEQNESRYEKNLWSSLGEGEKIGVYLAQNEKEEAFFAIKKIKELVTHKQISLDEIVIFYRTNAQSRIFEDILLSKRLPYEIIGGLSFYQRKEIKDVIAFLRLIITDSDLISFARTINIPKRGIGATTVKKLIELSGQSQTPILDLLRKQESLKLSFKQKEGLQDYLSIINKLRKKAFEKTKIHELIDSVLKLFRYDNYLKEDPEIYEDRKANIEALISKAAEWEEEAEEPSLTHFLEELTLKSYKEKNSDEPSIKLMTLHNGKGLEFTLVFVTGLEEDLLPHINSKDNPESLEEERRLFYVGMTRAKKHLFLLGSHYRYIWGTPRRMQPSRFFREIPAKYLDNFSPEEIQDEEEMKDDFLFSKGDRVSHQEFGSGTIQKTYHTSYGPTYDVFFELTNTTRSLVAKYAKLHFCS